MIFTFQKLVLSVAAIAILSAAPATAQLQPLPQPPPPDVQTSTAGNTILLTIFLRHDETMTLGEINEKLRQQNYYKMFPPPGIEVVSWYVMMGIGQVVTLRVPANRVRDVNRSIEESAWGAYRTEFYATYDYKAIAEEERKKNR
jgi:hypothetical protein